MSHATECLEIWKRIPGGQHLPTEAYQLMLRNSDTDPDAFALLSHHGFSFLPPEGLELVRPTVSFLGFTGPVQLVNLIEVGEQYGLLPCPTEVAPYLARQDDEDLNERFAIIMKPLYAWNNMPQTLDVIYTMKDPKIETRGNHRGVVFFPFETVVFAKK